LLSLTALIVALGASAGAQGADLDAGKKKATEVCQACHGVDGNSATPDFPKLGGQYPDYLAKALRDYKSGQRKNPIMAGFAQPLSRRTSKISPRTTLHSRRSSRRSLPRSKRKRRGRRPGSPQLRNRASVLALSFQAREIERRIGRRAVPLRIPQHFAEALEHRVLRGMLVAVGESQALVLRPNTGRLVDRELLGDREVQRQMQERIHAAALRKKIAIEIRVRRFEQRVILGMLADDRGRDLLERRQRRALPPLFPGVDQEAAGFVARWREHEPRQRVFGRYSQRSRIVHSGQPGVRATQM
jgi:hypothetical protein